VRALGQIGGFASKALDKGSFWSHAGKASKTQWLLTVARIDEVGRPAQRTVALAALGPKPALRPLLCACVPALAPVRWL
jgi:hypothetical protein